MAKFFQSENNGVVAIISEEHAKLENQIRACGGDPVKAGVRVFTFCDAERLKRNPEQRFYFTGTYDFARVLMMGHEMSHNRCGWSGYVPFSSQNYEDDRQFVTTAQDVAEVFSLVRN